MEKQIFYRIFLLLQIFSFVIGNNSPEFILNYTTSPTAIDLKTDYENFTIFDVKCADIGTRINYRFCKYLKPCTEYSITGKLFNRFNEQNTTFQKFIRTSYAHPIISNLEFLPFNDSVYITWTTYNENCIDRNGIRIDIDEILDIVLTNRESDLKILNLNPCTLYWLKLVVVDINGSIVDNTFYNFSTEVSDSGPVKDIQVSYLNDGSILITWKPPEHLECVQFYLLKWADSNCYEENIDKCTWSHHNISATEESALLLEGFNGCQEYILFIAVNGDSTNSAKIIFSPEWTPGPVNELRIQSKFLTNLTIIWEPPKNNSLCVLYYIISIKGINFINEFETTNNTYYTFNNLQPCEDYEIQVKPVDKTNNSLPAKNLIVTMENDNPGPVHFIEVDTSSENNTVLVKWKPPKYEKCVDFYFFKWTEIECDTKIDCTVSVKNITDLSLREFRIENLKGCQRYRLNISVSGDILKSSISKEFDTIPNTPSPVTDLKIKLKFSTNVTIIWMPPRNNSHCVEKYEIRLFGQDKNETYYTNDTEIYLEGLEPCGDYIVNVKPIANISNEIESNSLEFKMDIDRPSEVFIKEIKSFPKNLSITWEKSNFAPLCIGFYKIIAYSPKNEKFVFNDTKKETSVTIDNLIACITYNIEIFAITLGDKPSEGEAVYLNITTEPTILNAPSELQNLLTNSSTSLLLMSQMLDESNQCPFMYAKFACDATTDVKPQSAEVIVKILNSRAEFFGRVEPLAPYSSYKCTVSVYNIAGWSPNKTALLTTTKYFPEPPPQMIATSISNTSILANWTKPKYPNGDITIYKIYIQTIRPKYIIPSYCPKINLQNTTINVDSTKRDVIFSDAIPYVEYNIQIATMNDFGIGKFTSRVQAITHPWVSSAVEKFWIKNIEGPALIPEYRSTVTFSWSLPCQSNGEIESFEGLITGNRPGFIEKKLFWSVKVNSSTLKTQDNFEYSDSRLKPDYNYIAVINVRIKGVDQLSDVKTVKFVSPAGIPQRIDIFNHTQINTETASNPTTSVVVRFAKEIIISDMGKILYAAILLSEKGCQDEPILTYELIQSKDKWPNTPNWFQVNHQNCIEQYQTTPIRWEPNKNLVDNLKKDSEKLSLIEFIIGDENCIGKDYYCNGPLKPGTTYTFVLRLFTSSGYNDIGVTYLSTDSIVQVYFVLLLVLSCLLSAFIFGFIYLWTTKKIIWNGESCQGIKELSGDIVAKNFFLHFNEVASNEKLQREFKELTTITNDLNLSNIASKSNETKNRYSNIFPYDKNRVILDIDSEGSDYINASFINGYKRKKEYIATQEPKSESFLDFWRMILQHNISVIVMVTQIAENDTIKCHQYYPRLHQETRFGNNIIVTCIKEIIYETYNRRELIVEHVSDFLRRKVIHFQFKKWPDHDCPPDPFDLINFIRIVKSEKISRHSPITIHCSAGVGGTGTFICLDIILQRLKSERTVNIFETVKELRFQRMKMVQTLQQYQFLHNCTFKLIEQKYLPKKIKGKYAKLRKNNTPAIIQEQSTVVINVCNNETNL